MDVDRVEAIRKDAARGVGDYTDVNVLLGVLDEAVDALNAIEDFADLNGYIKDGEVREIRAEHGVSDVR